MKPIGSRWLKSHFKLDQHILTHSSFIGNNESIVVTSKGNVEQVYGAKYQVREDTPFQHLEFSLKYDDLNLDFFKSVFRKIPQEDFNHYIASSPGSKYARKIGFLFEFLTNKEVDLRRTAAGNYVDLLDSERYVTGQIKKNQRWRINDNLLGVPSYCPIIRKTSSLKAGVPINIQEKIESLKDLFRPNIFSRTILYLYKKETKSSFEIENETATPDRMEKFVALLAQAGGENSDNLFSEQRLTNLQKEIVDSRYAANHFRKFQNYVGQSLPNFAEHIHYVCPPPEMVSGMMKGLQSIVERTKGVASEIRAGLLSFGFVFIHPYEDGNGRLHRFLIHDILAQDHAVPHGLIIPISAHMLNNIAAYDSILENYSRPLMNRVVYERLPDGSLVIQNASDVEGYFRYPDLTAQCIYLIEAINSTLKEDLLNELTFIERYDQAKNELQNIVDMPDRDLSLMLNFLHQNNGFFPKRRRRYFAKLSDEEIDQIQLAYRIVFKLEIIQ